MLGKLKARMDSRNFSGQTDFLEAVCAACALVASAEDGIDDHEVEATLTAIRANKPVAASFSPAEITRCAQTMMDRAGGGRVGRMGLYAEIEEVAGDAVKGETVALAAIDVAEAGDGVISPKERAVLDKIGEKLGVKIDALLEV